MHVQFKLLTLHSRGTIVSAQARGSIVRVWWGLTNQHARFHLVNVLIMSGRDGEWS